MLTILPNPIVKHNNIKSYNSNPQYVKALATDTYCFSTPSFKGNSWNEIKILITEQKIINGEKIFVNVNDFIKNGEKSLLCEKIPILKDIFSFRVPLKDYTKNKYTVGEHTINVVEHLVEKNEDFKSLNLQDKEMMLVVALFHDIGKTEQPIKKSLLKKEDFENINFNANTEFDKYLDSKMKELKVFNSFSDYKQKIINYFKSNNQLDEVLIHNNTHPENSVKLLNKFLSNEAKNNEELKKINFLIKYHQSIGSIIDKSRYQSGHVDEAVFIDTPIKISKYIKNSKDLSLLKLFHVSDAYGVPQTKENLSIFLQALNRICMSTDEIINHSSK